MPTSRCTYAANKYQCIAWPTPLRKFNWSGVRRGVVVPCRGRSAGFMHVLRTRAHSTVFTFILFFARSCFVFCVLCFVLSFFGFPCQCIVLALVGARVSGMTSMLPSPLHLRSLLLPYTTGVSENGIPIFRPPTYFSIYKRKPGSVTVTARVCIGRDLTALGLWFNH